MRKPLTSRQLQILRGEAGHSREKRENYRRSLYAAGYDVPGMWWRIGLDLVSKAARFGKSAARHVAKGFPKPPPEVIAERMAICKACPEWRDGKCSKCGCGLKAKTAWAGERCPANPPRWERYSPLVETVDHPEALPLAPGTIDDAFSGQQGAVSAPSGVAHDGDSDEEGDHVEFSKRQAKHDPTRVAP